MNPKNGGKTKIKNFKTKNVTSVIAVLLILSFVVSMIALPSANAQSTTRSTFPYVEIVPSKVASGQTVLINVGLLNALTGSADGWNMTLYIEDPDGIVDKRDVLTWSTGMAGINYTPTKDGVYKLKATFAQTVYRDLTYLASETGYSTLTVGDEYWKSYYPGHALPSQYWCRPVDGQLREWWSLMGSWLIQAPRNTRVTNVFAPFNDAPETAHILWRMPDDQYPGGISGDFEGVNFQHGDAYEGKFYGAIIVAGVLYYNMAPVYNGGNNGRNQAIRAIDIHTGKILWEKDLVKEGYANTVRLTHGQVMIYYNQNNRGAWSYLWLRDSQWGNNWFALNPVSGDLIFNITNVPSLGQSAGNQNPSTSVAAATLQPIYFGPSGEMLIYTVTNRGTTEAPDWALGQWNSTRCVAGVSGNWGSTSSTAAGRTFDGNRTACYDWFIPLERNFGRPIVVFPEDRAVFANVTVNGVTLSSVSLAASDFGRMIYANKNWSESSWQTLTTISDSSGQSGWAAFSNDPYVGVYWMKEQRINYVFDLKTGNFLWKSEPHVAIDGLGGATSNSAPERAIAYGYLISGSVGGIVYCYNVTNGDVAWKYEVTDPHIGESYLTERWWLTLCFISSGKAYFGHHEHSALVPQPRGAPFFAIDIATGDVVWRIDGAFRQGAWSGRAIIGDSIIVTLDTYDSQIYAIGKGPTAITASAPSTAITLGQTILISGTIMDISPGTQADDLKFRFPRGVPAMSDDDMSEWMLHVYKHFDLTTHVNGVTIDVWAIDPNGNDYYVGETVSDAQGNFVIQFTPEIPGQFDIFTFFYGSKAYYGDYTNTPLLVVEAEPAANNNMLTYGLYAIGIIAIVVVLLFGLLIIRKK